MPFRFAANDDLGNEVIFWANSKYSLTLFCRPIQFEFAKETTEKTKSTQANIENQIVNLTPTLISSNVTIGHKLIMSMINGKVNI